MVVENTKDHSVGHCDEKLTCLVADSAAFLRNVDLENLTHNVFTIGDVIREIRDSATKQRLAVLPYEINFRVPSAESIHIVTEFSKKTGDYKSLSAVDIQVLALTYQLEKEFCNSDHINIDPAKKSAIVGKANFGVDKEISGFYFEPKKVSIDSEVKLEESDTVLQIKEFESPQNEECGDNLNEDEVEMEQAHDSKVKSLENCNMDTDGCQFEEIVSNKGEIAEGSEVAHGFEDADDDNDDNDGWITPNNLDKVKQTFGMVGDTKIKESNVKSACLTTDFAMQNVLIQMGLHVLSVEGMLIKQARSYIQKCFGCFKETHDMTKIFCSSCGNKTLRKVAVTVAADGTMQYHYPKKMRNPRIKGTIFPIPAPKGGRHGNPYILVEDQPTGKKMLPKSKDKADPLDPDYCARTNPFSFNDVNSRAFNLGLHVRQRQPQNPNQSKKKRSGRKK